MLMEESRGRATLSPQAHGVARVGDGGQNGPGQPRLAAMAEADCASTISPGRSILVFSSGCGVAQIE
jgi:hypothetical protein